MPKSAKLCQLLTNSCPPIFSNLFLQGCHSSLQGLGPVGVFPADTQILPAHVAIGGQLAVNGLAEIQIPDDGGGGQVKDPVPKVSTMMDTGLATPMA